MTGLQITLSDVTFTGSTAPLLPDIDPVASPSGGLLLIDASHPNGGFPAGDPVNNQQITNLLGTQAASLLGVSASTLNPTNIVSNMTSTFGKIERTTKGGIHAIQSTTQTTGSQGYQLRYPTNIIIYMKANSTHAFYLSVWNMPTKIISGATSLFSQRITSGGHVFAMGNYLNDTTSLTRLGTQNATSLGTVNVPWLSAQAVICTNPAWVAESNTNTYYNGLFEVGNFDFINQTGKNGARVFYRAYLEDLTLSGRTYDEVLALDNAEFAKQVTTAGGRFYGDTIATDPAGYAS